MWTKAEVCVEENARSNSVATATLTKIATNNEVVIICVKLLTTDHPVTIVRPTLLTFIDNVDDVGCDVR
jgi:hypothetical protein